MKRSIALLISVLMIFGLFTGCGNTTSGGQSATGPISGGDNAAIPEGAGTLLVNAGAIMTVIYDEDGSVLKLNGLDEDGKEFIEENEGQLGSDCAQVVAKFIKGSVMWDYMTEINHVVIKVNKGSALPNAKFLENIEAAAKEAVATAYPSAALVMITEENLDHNGYINLVTAKELVEKFLQVDDLDSFDGTATPVNGVYAFNVVYGNMEEQVLVNAETGGVGQGTLDEVEDDLEEIEEEETTAEESQEEETIDEEA